MEIKCSPPNPPIPPGRKNASGDFFLNPNQCVWELPPEAQVLCREKRPVPTASASGRGLWLSADPIKEDGGLNLYAYVLNDPVNMIDPDGLDIMEYSRPNRAVPGTGWVAPHYTVIVEVTPYLPPNAKPGSTPFSTHGLDANSTGMSSPPHQGDPWAKDPAMTHVRTIPATREEGDLVVQQRGCYIRGLIISNRGSNRGDAPSMFFCCVGLESW